jgi:biotin operon repressor
MIYQQSQEIESRLTTLLALIQTGSYSTPRLASALNVSIPTVSRCIHALRHRGHPITAVRNGGRWFYRLAGATTEPSSHAGRP